MGLTVSVYRRELRHFNGDCSNGGISANALDLCLVNVEGPDRPNDETPAALLVDWRPFGQDVGRRLVKIVAAELVDGEWKQLRKPTMNGPMFGGNYAGCSDSRFNEAVEKSLGVMFYGAVPIHDRFE
jgi:hypothetical protein